MIPQLTVSSAPESITYIPFTIRAGSPWRISADSGMDCIGRAMLRKWMASSRLLLPMPFSPSRQFTPGENSSLASRIFLKSSMSICSSLIAPRGSFLYAVGEIAGIAQTGHYVAVRVNLGIDRAAP